MKSFALVLCFAAAALSAAVDNASQEEPKQTLSISTQAVIIYQLILISTTANFTYVDLFLVVLRVQPGRGAQAGDGGRQAEVQGQQLRRPRRPGDLRRRPLQPGKKLKSI